MSRCNVCNDLRDEEGVEAWSTLLVVVPHLVLKRADPSDTGGEDDPDPVQVFLLQVQCGVFDRFGGRYERQLSVAVVFARLFSVKVFRCIEALHLAGKLRLEFGGIKLSDGPGSTHPVQ